MFSKQLNFFSKNHKSNNWSNQEIHYFGKRKEIIVTTLKRFYFNKVEFKSKAENILNSDFVNWGKINSSKFQSITDAKERLESLT